MAPVIVRLRRDGREDVRILATGQHRSLLDQALRDFGLAADDDLDLMRPDQKLADLAARAIAALSRGCSRCSSPDLVLAQGDTSTVFCAALACHYHRDSVWPRRGRPADGPPLSSVSRRDEPGAGRPAGRRPFRADRAGARISMREGIDPARIHVTGNTVIDALLLTAGARSPFRSCPRTPDYLLVTAHRRENFGEPLEQICLALRDLVERDPDLSVVFPVHPNPEVRRACRALACQPAIEFTCSSRSATLSLSP